MPRPGPRRQLFAVRVDQASLDWLHQRAEAEQEHRANFARKVIRFAMLNMPEDWEEEPCSPNT